MKNMGTISVNPVAFRVDRIVSVTTDVIALVNDQYFRVGLRCQTFGDCAPGKSGAYNEEVVHDDLGYPGYPVTKRTRL
jgi:hypothetical protein